MQQIGFRDLKVPCIIGLHPHEREHKQLLLIDAAISCEEFIDYSAIADLANEIAEKKFFLIEKLALELAKAIRERFREALQVKICVKKPGALPDAAYAFAEVVY